MKFAQRKDDFLVWVIAPFLETDDPNLKFYYDYTQSIAEYQRGFNEVGCEWKWVNVTLNKVDETIQGIKDHISDKTSIVINLCDGDESNGVPGTSVIAALERHNLPYTGSND